jgi:hypothetical protein
MVTNPHPDSLGGRIRGEKEKEKSL